MKQTSEFVLRCLVILVMGGCIWAFAYQLVHMLPPGLDELIDNSPTAQVNR